MCAGEKLRILQALVGKLLTLASSRDLIEDCVEEQRAARQELREIRAEQHRREREEAAHRYIQVYTLYTGVRRDIQVYTGIHRYTEYTAQVLTQLA